MCMMQPWVPPPDAVALGTWVQLMFVHCLDVVLPGLPITAIVLRDLLVVAKLSMLRPMVRT
jgi:hypothetical protein